MLPVSIHLIENKTMIKWLIMFQWRWQAQDQQVVEASSLMLVELEVEQLAELLVELQVLFRVYFYILIHIFSKLCFKV